MGGGIVVQPAVGGTAAVTISNSRINNNSDAVKANSTNGVVVLTVRDSTLSDNVGSGISSNAGNTLFVMSDRNTISSNAQNAQPLERHELARTHPELVDLCQRDRSGFGRRRHAQVVQEQRHQWKRQRERRSRRISLN